MVWRDVCNLIPRILKKDRSKLWSSRELIDRIESELNLPPNAYNFNLIKAVIGTMALCGHVHADSALRDIRWKDANAGTAEEVEVRLRIRTDAKGKITVNKQQKRLR